MLSGVRSSREGSGECPICFQPYDRSSRLPLLLCTNRHTICKHCTEQLTLKFDCPFCREHITSGRLALNKDIYRLLTDASRPNHRQLLPGRPLLDSDSPALQVNYGVGSRQEQEEDMVVNLRWSPQED
jgi:hypothetical protein